MAFSGLIALIDDIATIADDVATLTVLATKKTTGVVTDDMAVTAEQTLGIKREREIPVVLRVARGSILNKAVFLAPGALALNAVAPWSITPILMAGGTFLCFEGVEKLVHKFFPGDHDGHATEASELEAMTPEEAEDRRVKGAIRTDLILSGEVIAIALGEVAHAPFMQQVLALYLVSVVMTVGVYGVVAGLIKLDDLGEAMVLRGAGMASVGKAILWGAPWLLKAISWIGMVAMLLVGGHILLEGIVPLEHAVHDALHHVPASFQGVAGIGVDLAIGLVAGGVVVGIGATGVPAKLWALRPWARHA
jgi:predicted DNA repair protein MutK